MLVKKLKYFWSILVIAFNKFLEDNIFLSAAALSYYTIFSLPPMLLVILYTTTLFYDPQTMRQTIFGELSDIVGSSSASELATTVDNIGLFEGKWWATVVGIAGLLFTSTTVFVTIQDALNKMFMVKPKPQTGILKMARDRVISFTLLLGIAFVLLVSLTVNVIVTSLSSFLIQVLPGISVVVVAITTFILPFFIVAGLFALIFKYLPDVRLPWRSVRNGGIFTAVLFFIGMYAIEFYIGTTNTANLYQAAGSVMVIMVWVFYASIIFLFGAAFTFAYNQKNRNDMPAEEYAVKIVTKQIEVSDNDKSLPENRPKEKTE